MPELPDVEGFRRTLELHVLGQTINEIDIVDASVLRNSSGAAFRRSLEHRRVLRADRQGKWLLAGTDGPLVLFHFGMTGSLAWLARVGPRHRHDRVVFVTDAGHLCYRDQRKLRGLWLANDDAAAARIIGPHGADALGLTRRQLEQALSGRRATVKAALMDQRVIGGLGNTLSDEVLWRARLHPARRTDSLDPADLDRLHRSLGAVLRTAVPTGRIPRRASWLSSQRADPSPTCPRCRHDLERTTIGGRTSVWCPRCQPVLAVHP